MVISILQKKEKSELEVSFLIKAIFCISLFQDKEKMSNRFE